MFNTISQKKKFRIVHENVRDYQIKTLIMINYFTLGEFFTRVVTVSFHCDPNDSKSHHFSGNVLSILADFNRCVLSGRS